MKKRQFLLTYESNSGTISSRTITAKNKPRAKQKAKDTIEEMNEGCNWTSYSFISLEEVFEQ